MKCPLCTKELQSRKVLSYHLTRNHSNLNMTELEKETLIINTIFTKEDIKEAEEDYIDEKYPISGLPIDIVKYLTLKGLKRTASEEKKDKQI